MTLAPPPTAQRTRARLPVLLTTSVPDLDAALKQIASRRDAYAHARAYYNGDHQLTFATEKFRNAFGTLFQAFADNVCAAVVDAVADRLELTGFGPDTPEIEGEPGDDVADIQETDAWAIWRANRMDQRAGEVHQEALTCGDSYLIVWPGSDGQPRLHPQRADRMTVQYDSDNDDDPAALAWAAKVWIERDQRARATLYYPDRIEKYVTTAVTRGSLPARSSAFVPYAGPDGSDPWPVANPYGMVPVVHFANNAPVGTFGRSELHDAIPLQNALNKSTADMLLAMEFVAMPQRWMTGVEVPIDPATGLPDERGYRMSVDRVLAVANDNARFGEFTQANLAQFIQVQDSFRMSIARVTGTPLHYMQMISTPPSGQALKTLESRFVKKCRDRQTAFGNSWERALELAEVMRGSAGIKLNAQWIDPAPKSELELAQTIRVKQAIGIDDRTAMLELGYGEQQVDKMLTEKNARAAAAQAALAAQATTTMPVPTPPGRGNPNSVGDG